jgi:hypothetical protein
MKVLAALAALAMAAAIGSTEPQAAERTAKLNDPATSGQTQFARRGAAEKASLPASIARTGLSEVELDRIRGSIRAHIRAVTARDAAGAYESLTPIIKDYYSNSNAFLDALTTELKPVVNAESFTFASIEREAEDAVQSVVLTDPRGREWLARYRLQRQGDGSWAIQSCLVEPVDGRQT